MGLFYNAKSKYGQEIKESSISVETVKIKMTCEEARRKIKNIPNMDNRELLEAIYGDLQLIQVAISKL